VFHVYIYALLVKIDRVDISVFDVCNVDFIIEFIVFFSYDFIVYFCYNTQQRHFCLLELTGHHHSASVTA